MAQLGYVQISGHSVYSTFTRHICIKKLSIKYLANNCVQACNLTSVIKKTRNRFGIGVVGFSRCNKRHKEKSSK